MTKSVKLLSLLMSLIMLVSAIAMPASAYAASPAPKTVYSKISKAYGTKFPLKSGSKALSSKSVGVSSKYYASYYGRVKGNNKEKYIVYVAKAKKSSDVKKIKSALNNYVNVESHSMANYLSAKGKKLYKNAKVGSKGLYVYLIMVDTSGNTKGVNAFKKAV